MVKSRFQHMIFGAHGILYLILASKVLFFFSFVMTKVLTNRTQVCNWDCYWYISIIESGYQAHPNTIAPVGAANWAFFPVMPLIVRAFLYLPSLTPLAAGIIVNSIALYFSLIFLEKLIPDKKIARVTSCLIAISPLNVYINTLYTESIYFFLAIVLGYLVKVKRYYFAIIVAATISATRVTGSFLSLALCGFLVAAYIRREIKIWTLVLGSLTSFVGILSFSIYLKTVTGDALAFLHIQTAWGTGNLSFFQWVKSVGNSNSPTLYIYFILLLSTSAVCLYLICKRDFYGAVLTGIPVVTTVTTSAVNFRYFLVSYVPYLLIGRLIENHKLNKKLIFLTGVGVSIATEVAWLTGQGFMI